MSCIEEDVALALVQGHEVPASVRAHLAGCEVCREFVAGLARVMVPDATASVGGWGLVEGQLEPGTRLADYVLESVLGRGGMGVVYAGRDTRLDRAVAIKLLRDEVGPKRVAWLRREAAAMAKLSHPNVAEVFDFGECELGPFVVMERIRGETLGHWISASQSTEAILDAFAQAGQGLAAAHAAGIVHRDFKPSNAMIVTEGDVGRVKVLDFGLAAAFEGGSISDADVRSASTLGGLGGTPRYAAPEQFLGDPTTPKTDQFSFCVAMFEALAGELPFPGETGSERRTAMLAGQLRPLPGVVPESVARALRRGLSLEPDRRFGSMAALLAAFQRPPSLVPRAMALAGVAALGLWFAWPAKVVPCDDGTQRMHGAWPKDREVDWTTRPELVAQAERLDRYVDEWLEVRARLCAVRVEDPTRFERGAGCLERLASRTQRTGARLLGLGATAEPLPSNLLGDLDSPQRCMDESLDDRANELLRDEFESLHAWALEADADGILSNEERTRIEDAAQALLVRARALGDARVQGQLAHLLGTLAIFDEDYARAERWLQEGFFVADLSGDRESQLIVTENLVRLYAQYLAEPDRALYWADKAGAVAEMIGTDLALGQAGLQRASALLAAGESEAALAILEEIEPQLRGTIHHRLLVNGRAMGHAQLQQRDEARADINESILLTERELGLHHPELVVPLNMLATLEIIEENFDEAMALLERIVGLISEEDRLRRALVRGNLAILLLRTGRSERALETFEAIAAEFEVVFGPEHEQTIRTKLAIVETLTDLGRTEEARTEVERLLARGLPDAFLSRALLAHASVVEDPRPDLERILTLPNETESTLKIAREGLAALDSAG